MLAQGIMPAGYSASPEAVMGLSERFMAQHPVKDGGVQKRFAIRVIHPESSAHRIAQWLEANLFSQEFGDRPEVRQNVWSGYEERSFSIVAFERSDDGGWVPRGTMRIVHGQKCDDFKSVVNMKEFWGTEPLVLLNEGHQIEWTRTWDIATLAVDRSNLHANPAGWRTVLAIIHALHRLMKQKDIEWLLGILAKRAYDELDRMGLGLISLGSVMSYHNVLSQPFLLVSQRLPVTMAACPGYSRMVFDGQKLDSFDFNLDSPA